MRIDNEIKLDYKDVLIRPKRSTLGSRKEVSIVRDFPFGSFTPVVASNMTTVGTVDMAKATSRHNMITCLHKFVERRDFYTYSADMVNHLVFSIGILDDDFARFEELYDHFGNSLTMACIDVANGYTQIFVDAVKRFKDAYPDVILWAGNVVTAEMTEELCLAGADVIKVGIGSGAACTTRLVTGVGYPQLSAVIECADAAHGLGGFVCADGGITNVGDIAKALGAGADFVMLGGFLAGHEEGGGEILELDGKEYVEFYGMSSKKANDKYSGGLRDYRSSEGRELLLPYKGSVEDTLQNIEGGLRSACTYVGAKSIKELSKRTTFVRVNSQYNNSLEHHVAV